VTGLGETVMILDLHRQGAGVSAIALRTELDRKTAANELSRLIVQGIVPRSASRPAANSYPHTAAASSRSREVRPWADC
jgi:hypothetical protein